MCVCVCVCVVGGVGSVNRGKGGGGPLANTVRKSRGIVDGEHRSTRLRISQRFHRPHAVTLEPLRP